MAGDLATVAWKGGAVPGVAPAANQMGRHAARNIVRTILGQPRRAFAYVDKGSLATIGRKSAVRTCAATTSPASPPGWPGSASTSSS